MSDQLRGVAGCVGTGGKAPICESGNFFFFELRTLVDDRWHGQWVLPWFYVFGGSR